jgi:hypothetical protein
LPLFAIAEMPDADVINSKTEIGNAALCALLSRWLLAFNEIVTENGDKY